MQIATIQAKETDEQLMARFQVGDSRAMEELFARFQKPLFNYFYRMLGRRETAEDLVQETFVKLCRFGDSFRGSDAKFSTWLYSVAGNQCRDYLRHTGRRPEAPLADFEEDFADSLADQPSDDDSPEDHIIRMETRAALKTTVDSLPEREREAIILREYQGLEYKEIADIIGCPLGSVKVLIYRARQRLRDRMKDLELHI